MAAYLTKNAVHLHLQAESEMEAIEEMLALVRENAAAHNIRELAGDLLQREVVSPSATGSCAIVFRVLSPAAKALRLFFGRFERGIGYVSRSGLPIDLIFLVIAPPEQSEEFAALVLTIETLLLDQSVRKQLRAAKDANAVTEILARNFF